MVPKCYFWGPGPWTIGGEATLTRKKITSGHRSTQPHFHVRNQFRIWTGSPIGYSHVKLFYVANQGRYYIVNSLRTWEYPIGDPVQILNWFLTWKWGCVLLWPEVIFFLVNAASPPTISIDKKKINRYVPNKLTKVLFHARNLCKAAGKIVAVSARWKTRGQGPGMGKRGVWKTWGVDNTGPKWKTRGVENTGCVEKTQTKTVFVNKYLPYQWLWTKCRQRHASLPKFAT